MSSSRAVYVMSCSIWFLHLADSVTDVVSVRVFRISWKSCYCFLLCLSCTSWYSHCAQCHMSTECISSHNVTQVVDQRCKNCACHKLHLNIPWALHGVGFQSLPEQVNSHAWSQWDPDTGTCIVGQYRQRQSVVNSSWLLWSLQAPIILAGCPAGVPRLAQSLLFNFFVGGTNGWRCTPPPPRCAPGPVHMCKWWLRCQSDLCTGFGVYLISCSFSWH